MTDDADSIVLHQVCGYIYMSNLQQSRQGDHLTENVQKIGNQLQVGWENVWVLGKWTDSLAVLLLDCGLALFKL